MTVSLLKKTLASAMIIGGLVAVGQPAAASERYCREYQKNVTVGGRIQQAYGTACMQPDGSWEAISGPDYQGNQTYNDYYQPAEYIVEEPVYYSPAPVYQQTTYYEEPDYTGVAVLGTALIAGVAIAAALDDDDDYRGHRYNRRDRDYRRDDHRGGWGRGDRGGHRGGRGHGRH